MGASWRHIHVLIAHLHGEIEMGTLELLPDREHRPGGKKRAITTPTEQAQQVMQEAQRHAPRDCWGQLAYFFEHYRIPAAQGRSRAVSVATETKYMASIRLLINSLAEENIRIGDLGELTRKHLQIAMRKWEATCGASTLQTRYSCLARFYGWLGQELPFKSVKDTLQNPANGRRAYSAVVPKAWDRKGVDMDASANRVGEDCIYTAMYLRLARGFGLRVQEAAALKPHESDRGAYLEILHGAKGGRGRSVPIATAHQRQLVEDAKALADPKTGLLRPRQLTIKQARTRFYHLMRKHGLTKSALGVTAHGLRHEYACAVYEEIAGVPAPVNQGRNPSREIEMAARKVVTSHLGHGRTSVTTAYTGSVVNIERHQMRHMTELLGQLQAPGGGLQAYMQALALGLGHEGELRVHVIGPEADGHPPQGAPLLLSVGYSDLQGHFKQPAGVSLGEIIRTMAPIVQNQLGRVCFIQETQYLPPDTPTLEVLFQNQKQEAIASTTATPPASATVPAAEMNG